MPASVTPAVVPSIVTDSASVLTLATRTAAVGVKVTALSVAAAVTVVAGLLRPLEATSENFRSSPAVLEVTTVLSIVSLPIAVAILLYSSSLSVRSAVSKTLPLSPVPFKAEPKAVIVAFEISVLSELYVSATRFSKPV